MNKKTMSKRELVSYIHALTDLSYKESRILCKKAKYIYPLAYYLAVDTLLNRESIVYYEDPLINPQATIIKPIRDLTRGGVNNEEI